MLSDFRLLSILCILGNMAEFITSNQEVISTFYAYPCKMPEIYLSGLLEGEILVSYDPFLILNNNGLVNGLNSDFNQFYHLDKNREPLSIIRLDWISTCNDDDGRIVRLEQSNEQASQIGQNTPQWIKIYSIEIMIMVIMMILVWRILIHEKD